MPGMVGGTASDVHASIIRPFGRRFSTRLSGQVAHLAGENRDSVTLPRQPARQFVVPRPARFTQRGERLMDDQDVHG